jgi:NADH-quinone oxidoreductase subunit E
VTDPAPAASANPKLKVLGPDDRAIKRGKIVDVLWDLQKKRGWIDDEAVKVAAKECDLTPLEVDEVATFFNLLLRQPAGRTPIFVCDSISCELCGSRELTRRLTEVLGIELGQVTPDGEFGLLPIVCLGHCEIAPCLMAGETIHGPLKTDRASIESLLQRIRNGRSPSQG